ncbi:MAG: hypothetical protein IKK04_01105 [Bacteroidales bacterium]|nr:hypothetical protein [Bacteroidales bacterium]
MNNFEMSVREDLYNYLLSVNEVDERLPEAVDIEAKYRSVAESYLADGVREFANYPSVSLGWMMYIGMAVARFWDDDWVIYDHLDDLYLYMRDKSGYDLLDEYIRGVVLGLKQPDFDTTEQLVQECAERTYAMLMRQRLEPGTEAAFRGYVACIHQLYLMGAYVQLHRMDYHMVKNVF